MRDLLIPVVMVLCFCAGYIFAKIDCYSAKENHSVKVESSAYRMWV